MELRPANRGTAPSFALALAACLAAPACAYGQLTLVHDHRHLELAANGEAGTETCSELDVREAAPPFAPLVEGSVTCGIADLTAALAEGAIRSEFGPGRISHRGSSHAQARANPSASGAPASSGFAISHAVIGFRVDAPSRFRITGRVSGDVSVHIVDHDGETIAHATGHHADLVREIGALVPGEYHFEIEATSSAAAEAAPGSGIIETAADAAYRITLDVLTGTADICAADIDADGHVTPADFESFVGAFFAQESSDPLSAPGGECDLDGSGAIDADDLAEFINAMFSGC